VPALDFHSQAGVQRLEMAGRSIASRSFFADRCQLVLADAEL